MEMVPDVVRVSVLLGQRTLFLNLNTSGVLRYGCDPTVAGRGGKNEKVQHWWPLISVFVKSGSGSAYVPEYPEDWFGQ